MIETINSIGAVLLGNPLTTILSFVLGTIFKSWIDRRSNTDLEKLRSDLRKRETEELEIRKRNDDRISAFVNQALQSHSARSKTIAELRLNALLELWTYAVNAAPLHNAAKFAQSINFKNAIPEAAKMDGEAEKIRQFADGVWKMSLLDDYKYDPNADKSQPLIPPIVWATFSAYRSIAAYPAAQLAAVRTGVGEKLLADTKELVLLGKSMLPQYADIFDREGDTFLPFVLDDMRQKLLDEIAKSLDDETYNVREIDRARSIMASIAQHGLMPEVFHPLSPEKIPAGIRQNLR